MQGDKPMPKVFFLASFWLGASLLLSVISQAAPLTLQKDQQVLVIEPKQESKALHSYFQFHEDKAGSLTISDLIQNESELEFTPFNGRIPNFGFTHSTFWGRIKLENPQATSLEHVFVHNYPIVDRIEFWLLSPSGKILSHHLAGDRIPPQADNEHYRTPIFRSSIPQGPSVLYIRIQTEGTLIFDLKILDSKNFSHMAFLEYSLFSACFGAIAALWLYNFFLWLQLKQKSHLLYLGFLFVMLFMPALYLGMATHLPFEVTWLMNEGYIISAHAAVAFAMVFVIHFLTLQHRSLLLYRICLALFWSSLAAFLLIPISYNISARVSIILASACSILTFTVGVYCCLQRYRPAYFFTLAWLMLILANFVRMLSIAGLVEQSFIIEWGTLLATVAEGGLIALALADKIRLKEKSAYERIDELNQNLEARVTQQTQELRLKNESLQEQKQLVEVVHDELKTLDQAKTAFFRQISHELRTPLTLILGSLNLLQKENTVPEVQSALRNAKRLLRLVNQLLDFQRVTQSRTNDSTSPINLREILHSIADAFADACRERNIQLCITDLVPDTIPPVIRGKVDSIEKILFNYLANALKYSGPGGRITLVLENVERRIRLSVEDQGPGIAPDQIKELFQVYKRILDPNNEHREGTGIGLALCKELAEGMKGEVGVTSQVGQGSSFWASFPLSTSSEPDQELFDILFIDDEPAAQTEFAQILTRTSHLEKIKIVGSFAEAEAQLRKARFRCVIADINLNDPTHNGVDLLVLSYELVPDAVRILMSGDRSGDEIKRALEMAHISKILFKPFDWRAELPTIEKLMKDAPLQHESPLDPAAIKARSLLHLADLTPDPSADEAPPPVNSSDGPLVLIVDDLPEMRTLIGRNLRDQGYQTVERSDGQDALQLLRENPTIELIITDWMMPRVSGPQLIAAIREDKALNALPIILLTAKGDDVSRQQGIQLGANAYLGKPFDRMELLSSVHNLVQLKKREKEVLALHQHVTQHVLKRYLPAGLVQKIINGEAELDETPKVKSVTIMFVDICNFTSRSESLGATRISRILNDFFSTMSHIIFECGGTIDKFIGDAIMIVFGAPIELSATNQVDQAMLCAEKLFLGLDQLNQQWKQQQLPAFQMRIGLHHGPAVVGSFGGAERSDYTVIGTTVNLASRIQGIAEPNTVFCSSTVRDYLSNQDLQEAGSFDIKGVTGRQLLFCWRYEAKLEAA
jgi:signal transduction histidine kinase/class 3 adenylate cyclase